MRNVSKNVFLNAIVCPSLGWLMRSEQPIEQLSYEALSLGAQFRIDQGSEIHHRARKLYPAGLALKDYGFMGVTATDGVKMPTLR